MRSLLNDGYGLRFCSSVCIPTRRRSRSTRSSAPRCVLAAFSPNRRATSALPWTGWPRAGSVCSRVWCRPRCLRDHSGTRDWSKATAKVLLQPTLI